MVIEARRSRIIEGFIRTKPAPIPSLRSEILSYVADEETGTEGVAYMRRHHPWCPGIILTSALFVQICHKARPHGVEWPVSTGQLWQERAERSPLVDVIARHVRRWPRGTAIFLYEESLA